MDEAQQENQRYRLGKCIMKIHEAVCLPTVCRLAASGSKSDIDHDGPVVKFHRDMVVDVLGSLLFVICPCVSTFVVIGCPHVVCFFEPDRGPFKAEMSNCHSLSDWSLCHPRMGKALP